jgi:hypothetical protein
VQPVGGQPTDVQAPEGPAPDLPPEG